MIKRKLYSLLHPFDSLSQRTAEKVIGHTDYMIARSKEEIRYDIRASQLKYLAVSATECGISKDCLCDHEVVVSLTTYRQRIHEVYLTIESIMRSTVKPNRIILWLAEDEFGGKDLPIVLQNQMKRGLEVRYCEDLRSYKKIIPTLQLCPDACIVTIDDDAIYEPDLLEHLIASYKMHPDCVSASRIHRIRTSADGMPLPYVQWDFFQYDESPSHRNFLTGVGGNLFPPHALSEQVTDQKTFMRLCPKGDDIWLNAMLMANGVKVVKSFTHNENGDDYVLNESPYVESLWSSNKQEDGNDVQIRAVWEKFQLQNLFYSK